MYNGTFDPAVAPVGTVGAHNNLDALTFQTTSAEYYALCVQTYRLAKLVLDTRLRTRPYAAPAVVMDLDETVLDNAAYQVYLARTGRNFHDDSWDAWCLRSLAGAVPGAVDFIEFARARNVAVFFITSRAEKTRAATLANLRRLGAIDQPTLDAEHAALAEATDCLGLAAATCLFMKDMLRARGGPTLRDPANGQPLNLNNKFEQRVYIEQFRRREVALSVGDNLSDYSEAYGKRRVYAPLPSEPDARPEPYLGAWAENGKYATWDERRQLAVQDRASWGTDFIVIPNPVYGGFLRAFSEHRLGASAEAVYAPDPVRGALEEDLTPVTYLDHAKGRRMTKAAAGPRLPYLYRWEPGAEPPEARVEPGAATMGRSTPA